MKLKYLLFPLIILNILLAARWVMDGNIFFHTDIARDFLLIEDIVERNPLTLIGPRSGAIPGLFHGPLWLYLNVPAFVLGQGDPVIVGWFWVLLYILSLVIIYTIGKKMFGEEEGLISATLLSAITALSVRSLFNPYGALIIFPIFFYFFIKYLQSQNFKTLLLALFLLGIIVQFQMAFGIPIFILTFFFLIYKLFKNKKLSHTTSLLVLFIPLSTFILFDIRNKFLQLNSVISYLGGQQSHGKLGLGLIQLIPLRIRESVTEGLGIITQGNVYLSIALLGCIVYVVYLKFRKKNNLLSLFLFLYFFFGFWLLAIFFQGPVWNYYFLPFIPALVLMFASLKRNLPKIFYPIFFTILFINIQNNLKDISSYNSNPFEQDVSTWKFNKLIAEEIFREDEKEFGYFIFTPDLYGYSPRFALNYFQKRNIDKLVYPYEKRPITYLVIAPPPEYGKDPSSVWYQKNTNSSLWKSNDVRINRVSDKKFNFKNSFVIEKYLLTEGEIRMSPNPNLIKDIFFR